MAAPALIGILDDGVGSRDAAASGDGSVIYKEMELDMQRAVDVVATQGRLDRDIAWTHEEGIGLPSGTAHNV